MAATSRKHGRRRKQGFGYKRVSDPKQVKRDFNPEGLSLPQQRRAAPYLPAADLEKHVADHYATIDFQPEFRAVVEEKFNAELDANLTVNAQLRESINKRLGELSVREDHYLDLVGHPEWPKDKLTAKMQAIRDERDKLLGELDRLDADLKVARDIISTALTLLTKPRRLYKAMTDSQRKLLNALVFTKLTVDAHGVTGEHLAEPVDALIPLGRYYTHHHALPNPDQHTDSQPVHGQADHPTAALPGHSSSKTTWVPPGRLVQHLQQAIGSLSCGFPPPSRLSGAVVARPVMRGERRAEPVRPRSRVVGPVRVHAAGRGWRGVRVVPARAEVRAAVRR